MAGVLLAMTLSLGAMNVVGEEFLRFRKDWKKYEKAVEKDLPRTADSILVSIAGKAIEDNSYYDMLMAVSRYGHTDRYDLRGNFRTVSSLVFSFRKDPVNYLALLANFYEIPYQDSLVAGMERYAQLLAGSHRLTRDNKMYSGLNIPDFDPVDDYEVLLRTHIAMQDDGIGADRIDDALLARLEEYCAGRPGKYVRNWLDAAMWRIDNRTLSIFGDKGEALARIEAYSRLRERPEAADYRFIVDARILAERSKLCTDEAGWKKLDADAAALADALKKGAALSQDKDISRAAQAVVKELGFMRDGFRWKEGHALFSPHPYPAENELKLVMKNISRMDAGLYRVDAGGKDVEKIWDASVDNPVRSFNMPDTVSVTLPFLGDGMYRLTVSYDQEGNEPRSIMNRMFEVASLAVSIRNTGDGSCQYYLTDARTGEPCREAGFTIDVQGKEPFSGYMEFDGFSSLPVDVTSYAEVFFVLADGRRSVKVGRYPYGTPFARENSESAADIFLDRSVCRRGDSVRFKLISYKADGRSLAADAARTVRLYLTGPDGRRVDSLRVVTNEFGSASGAFTVPQDAMNGSFCISSDNGAYKYFRAEDFRLSDCAMEVFPLECIYAAGDTVALSGRVTDANGTVRAGVEVRAETGSPCVFPDGDTAVTGPDGCFSLKAVISEGWGNVGLTAVFPDGRNCRGNAYFYADRKGFRTSLSVKGCDVGDASDLFVRGDTLSFSAVVFNNSEAAQEGIQYIYKVCRRQEGSPDVLVAEGTAYSGQECALAFAGREPGRYYVQARMTVRGKEDVRTQEFVYLPEDDGAFPDPQKDWIFLPLEDSYLFGAKDSLWVLYELYDRSSGEPLESEIIEFAPGLSRVQVPSYSGRDLMLSLLVVKNGRSAVFRHEYSFPLRPAPRIDVHSFRSKVEAGSGESFELVVDPQEDVELLVNIYDRTMDEYGPNAYTFVPRSILNGAWIPYPSTEFASGYVNLYAVRSGTSAKLMSNRYLVPEAAQDAVAAQEALPGQYVRKDFRNVLAFMPHLRPDAQGRVKVQYKASDRLSTFVMQVLAHRKDMGSAVVSREISVIRNVTVSASVPDFLREGDRLDLTVAVRNNLDVEVPGVFRVELFEAAADGTPLRRVHLYESDRVLLEAAGTSSCRVRLPEVSGQVPGYVLRFVFEGADGKGGSDGEEHFVRVVPGSSVQVRSLTAAGGKADFTGLLEGGEDALFRVRISSPAQSVVAAMPLQPASGPLMDDVAALLSLRMARLAVAKYPGIIASIPAASDAGEMSNTPWYRSALQQEQRRAMLDSLLDGAWCDSLERTLTGEIRRHCSPSGAFSWFPGGQPSVQVTLAVLERYASSGIASEGVSGEEAGMLRDALEWLDGEFARHLDGCTEDISWRKYGKEAFASDRFVHDYMYVRSFYVDKTALSEDAGRYYDKCVKLMSERIPKADILAKIKFARVLMASSRGSRAVADIAASLKEYAREDRWGNMAFVSGVRGYGSGVLDGEVFANAAAMEFYRLCGDDEASRSLAWHLFSLKEGSAWGNNLATSVAVTALLPYAVSLAPSDWTPVDSCVAGSAGAAALLSRVPSDGLCVVSLTRYDTVEPGRIVPYSSGMTVSREFARRQLASSEIIPLKEGEKLSPGDVVVCRYLIDNDEGRSFVRVEAMRPACFQVADLRSGYSWMRGAAASVYRNIYEDRSEYYIEYLPAGRSVLTEEFYVTREGVFSAGVLSAECCYVAGYGSNDAPAEVESAF